MSFQGYRITERREKLGYSQEDLAEAVSTSQKQISKYESGAEPGAHKLALLASALETTTDYLVGLTENWERPINYVSDLTDDERELLEIYRLKPREKRRQMRDIAKAL